MSQVSHKLHYSVYFFYFQEREREEGEGENFRSWIFSTGNSLF